MLVRGKFTSYYRVIAEPVKPLIIAPSNSGIPRGDFRSKIRAVGKSSEIPDYRKLREMPEIHIWINV